MSYYNPALS
jgi:hypothetical protein